MKRTWKFYGGYLLIAMAVLGSCKKNNETPSAAISGVTPMEGSVGTTVTLSGTNLNSTSAQAIVKFNGTQAIVTSASATELITTVPTGASTGKITVTLNGKTATSSSDFTVINEPVISSFSPAAGVAGMQVIITGSNFSSTPANNAVTFFDNQSAIVTAASSTQLTVTVPSAASTGKITVTTNGLKATSSSDFTVSAPTITSFSPVYGLPGSTITVTGTNFSTTLSENNVKISGAASAIVTAATSTQLTITIPTGSTTGKISVKVGLQTAISATDFEVLQDIPRTGLIAFYPFSGTANDASGNNLNGTPMNGPTLSNDRFGKANHAYSFDGTNDYIDMGNPSLLQFNTKITVAGWMKVTTVATGSNFNSFVTKIFFDPGNGGNPSLGYFIEQSYNAFGVHVYPNSSSLSLTSIVGNTVTAATWVFIALTIDDKTWKFYQNDTQPAGDTYGSTIYPDGSKGNLTIGAYSGGFIFNGSIDDITIYNRALSASEIQQLYTQTATKY